MLGLNVIAQERFEAVLKGRLHFVLGIFKAGSGNRKPQALKRPIPCPVFNPELAFNLYGSGNGNADDVGGHALNFMSKIAVINRKIAPPISIGRLPITLP